MTDLEKLRGKIIPINRYRKPLPQWWDSLYEDPISQRSADRGDLPFIVVFICISVYLLGYVGYLVMRLLGWVPR